MWKIRHRSLWKLKESCIGVEFRLDVRFWLVLSHQTFINLVPTRWASVDPPTASKRCKFKGGRGRDLLKGDISEKSMHRKRPRVPHHLLLVYPTSFSAYKGSGKSRQPKTKTQGDQEMCGHERVHRSLCSTTGLRSSTEFGTDTPSFPGGTSSTEIACQYRRHKRPRFNPWVRKIPWRRAWQPTPVSLPRDRGAQQTMVHRVTESRTQLKQLHTDAPTSSIPAPDLWFLPSTYAVTYLQFLLALLSMLQKKTLNPVAIWKWKASIL